MQPQWKDWAFLRSAAGDLQDYLLSKDLYRPLFPLPEDRGVGELVQLTPGNLLLAQARLAAFSWEPVRAAELAELNAGCERVIRQWKTAFSQKAAHEYHARLDLWREFLQDVLGSTPHRQADYPFQVRWRVILELLHPFVTGLSGDEPGILAAVDERLKRSAAPGKFVWEPDLEKRFPEKEFWYLYRVL
jgi:hypothetical protein